LNSRNQILIVDDMEINRGILSGLFAQEYTVLEAENGLEALELIQANRDSIAVILLDIVMPVMDGFQLMERLQKTGILQRVPVILITADSFHDNEIKGLSLGAYDIIMKPFDPLIVKKRVENCIELYRHKHCLEHLVELRTRKLTETNNFIIDALGTIIEYRSLESGQHIRRVRAFTRALLEQLSAAKPELNLTRQTINVIVSAAAMHDVGKITIPDSVLLKPGRLTRDEFEVMKTHTVKGCEVLQAFSRIEDKTYLRYCHEICRSHHERWDGGGYPDGLKKDEIPISAQVVSIADVYDALTSKRVYKPAYSHEEAVEMILSGECGVFSDLMLCCFRQVADRFQAISDSAADEDIFFSSMEEPDAENSEEILIGLQEASEALQKETLERDALINAIPGGVAKIAIDEELRILLASDGFFKLTGYTQAEYCASPIDGKAARLILDQDLPEVMRTLKSQTDAGAPALVEYRIRKKDSSVAWISANGVLVNEPKGRRTIQAVFIDITDRRKAQEQLQMNEARYRVIVDQAQDVIFDWNAQENYMYFSPAFARKFGYQPSSNGFLDEVLSKNILYKDDQQIFLEMLYKLLAGAPSTEQELRVRGPEGYIWCRIKATGIFDRDHALQRVIGTVTDVDEYKRTNALLTNKAQRDLLTGLYNKITAEELISECLEMDNREHLHAFMIFDIDNFREVNNTLGHMAGDEVLRMISARLKECFRSEDILGRLGGDEFGVLIRNIPSAAVARDKAQRLAQIFRQFSSEHKEYPMISTSVGVSLYPQHGEDFGALFRKADQALYRAKQAGKNCFRFYDDENA